MKRLKKQISMMTLLFFMCCVVLPIGPATPAEAMEGTTLTDAQIEGAIAWALNNKRATQANGDALTCMQFVYAAYQSVGINIGKYGSFGSSMIAYEQIRSENPAHIHTGTAPRGALVLYEPAPANDGLGHIALSLGNGRVISGNYTTTNGEILAVEHPQDNHLFYYKEKRSKRLNSFCWIWPYGYDTSTVGTTVVVPTAVTIQNNTVENIVENNAKLSAKILNNYQRVTEVGCYLGTDGVNWPYKASDAVNITDAYTNVWYDNAARDFGTVLQPGTTYYYKFYAVVNGTYSEGQVGSFTTTGIPRPPVGPEKEPVEIQNNSVADITETNAKLSAKVLNNYQKVTEVGCYLGKSQNHLNYKASDKVNITDVYTNVWYENIPTEFSVALEPGTTYYYQFYAVVNGQTYTGSVGSFTTKKAENKDPVVTFSNLTASNITQTNAILTAKVDNKSKSQITEIGCYAGINKNNLTLKARQGKYSTESLSLEFSMNQDFGETTLIADTMYYYQFYVIADGQEIKSEKKAFRSRSLGDIEREKLTEVFLALVGVDDIGDVTSILLSADSGRTGFWGVLEKAVNVKDRLELIMTAAKQIDDLTNMVGNNWISKKNPWQSLIARAEQIELAGAKGMAKAYNLGLKDANTNNPVPEEGLRQHESTVVEICDDVIKRIDEETSQFYMRMFFRDTRNRLLAYKRTLLELKADYDLMEFYNLGRYGTEGVSQ